MSSLSLVHELPSLSCPLEELKPFFLIQLVVLDLDGTLLQSSDSKPGYFINTLKNAIANDVKLTVATGRTLKGALEILDKLNLSTKIPDTTPTFAIVLYNGSLVINPKSRTVFYHIEIPASDVSKVTQITAKYLANTFIYEVNTSDLVAKVESEKVYFVGFSDVPQHDFNGMEISQWDSKIVRAATAILIKPTIKSSAEDLINELKSIGNISVTSSGGEYIEIRPANSSKANGMQNWINFPGVTYKKDQILAVGDNDNDIELLEWAGIGVAVKTASKAAINASNYITKYGAEKGVIEVLKLLKQSKRYKNIGRHFA